MSGFARALPLLDDSTITPARLEELGLWSADARAAAERLHDLVAGTPRYFSGRQVLVPGGQRALGMLRDIYDWEDRAVVDVEGDFATEHVVSWRALLSLNQRHILPCTVSSD